MKANSPVVEGGVSPPSEGLYQTKCTIAIRERRFHFSMLFRQTKGVSKIWAISPLNGANLYNAETVGKSFN